MSVSEFVDHWLEDSMENHEGKEKSLLYLKDWHFVKVASCSISKLFLSEFTFIFPICCPSLSSVLSWRAY